MNSQTLSLFVVCALAAAASAQIKTPPSTQLPPKNPHGGPVYVPPPPGTQLLVVGGSDDCSTAMASDALSGAGTFAITNVGATNGGPDGAGCVSTQLDVWFHWTSTQAGNVRLQFCGQTTVDTVVAVWADNNGGACPLGTTTVVCNDDACGLQSYVTFPATNGQTFLLQIGAYSALTTYSSNFVIDYLPPPPPEDDCSMPVVISGLGTFPMNTNGAVAGSPAPSCGTAYSDIWFFWTATQVGTARFSACGGTTGATRIAAWVDNNGGACPSGTSLACNNVVCGAQSQVTFPTTIGQTFFIQMGSTNAIAQYSGTFVVDYLPPPPAHDSCAMPLALPAGDGTHAYDSTMATTGVEGQTEAACLDYATSAIYKDLWFTWSATQAGIVTFTTCPLMTGPSVNADTRLAVYDGAGCPTTAALACNDDSGHSPANPVYTCVNIFNSTLTFTAVCGQTYTLQVGQFSAGGGNMIGSFRLTETPGTPCVPPAVPFCFGDGALTDHTTPCPCANNGATGNGCANSLNPLGANLATTGSTGLDNVVLNGSGMPLTVACIYLQGTALDDILFGDGVRCTGGTLLRLRTKINSGGVSSFPDSTDTVTLSVRGGVTVGSGAVRQYQTYYRNSAALFCPPETFNVTNGVQLTW